MHDIPNKKWIILTPETSLVRELTQNFEISSFLAKLLVNRNVSASDAHAFLNPTLATLPRPERINGLLDAAKRIAIAIQNNEKILIHGDYDVDGISSTSVILLFFKELHYSNISFYIPDRITEGYGLNVSNIERFKNDDVSLLITVDCGITSHAAADAANTLGIDLIITDHHEAPDTLPVATAIVNPKLDTIDEYFEDLCGVGIAFYLIIALRQILREQNYFEDKEEPNIKQFLDLVALGSIADIVPVSGINRALISTGLKLIATTPRPGIWALKKVSGIMGKSIGYGTVGFSLAPRLNAAGRLFHAGIGVDILTSNDKSKVASIAQKLDTMNQKRQSIENKILEQCLIQIENDNEFQTKKSICLMGDSWHHGVVGIVASRLIEKFHKPTILLACTKGSAKGSGRSIKNFNLYNALSGMAHYFTSFGGHEYAAGLTLDESNFTAFAHDFELEAKRWLSDDDMRPSITCDMELTLEEITQYLINDISALEPFGPKNSQPIFFSTNLTVVNKTLLKDAHIKLTLKQGHQQLDAIGFRMPDYYPLIKDSVNIAFTPQINEFNGNRKIQLLIKDIKIN